LSDLQEGEMKGIRLRGIFELQSDGRLKLDFWRPEEPALKEFSSHAVVFSKATSPIVRPNKPPPPTPAPYVAPTPAPDEALITEGKERHERGDNAGAIEALSKAIALNPKNANAFFWRGMYFFRTNDDAAAIADFEKAMELDPTMNLQDLIDKTKIVLKHTEEAKATASPEPEKPTASPARSRAKTKRKP
jgi:tetratricopeptide (TPR) repeat protein